jgi:RNA polymerase sigma-70 factor (ECF subfamily)
MEQQHELAEREVTRLYDDYYLPILRYLTRLCGSREAAEDLAQETFLKALRHWDQRASADGTVAWLFRIARNTAYDDYRHRRRGNTFPFTDLQRETLAGRDTEPEIEEIEAIQAALSQLPESTRAALLLHSYAGYPLDMIAETMGWKLGTVKSRLSRARAQFRKHYAA